MPNSLSELKNKRKDRFDKLKNKVENMDKGSNNQDDRFWKPEVDKSGNGFAVIRFLDAPQGEDLPYIRRWSHAFQGPNGWYIENSLTTLGQSDPISNYNRRLWNSGVDEDKKIVRAQKRKLSYISNIYVVKDSSNPENEGKVFLYRFGKKIFDKIKDKMEPEFEDETPENPFDFWEGSNFRLKIRNVDGYRNYDKSEFDSPSPLFDDDSEIEKVWKSEFPLQEFVDESAFKSYAELKERLDKVMGFDTESQELYRPGDVVSTSPKTHETAEEKIQEKLVNKKEAPVATPPKSEPQQTTDIYGDDSTKESSGDDDDYFDDLVSKL